MSISSSIPTSPGVYLHKNAQGEVIYVGKAKNLRKRVASYTKSRANDPKTARLVCDIAQTDFIVTNNELEALLLENRLIKQHRPTYNIQLKDTSRYSYICVTKERFPRVLVTRKTNKKDLFFGPFTASVTDITKIIREVFRMRSCCSMPNKTCMYYNLNLCTGPCEGKISAEEYQKSVKEAVHLIASGNKELIDHYQKEMQDAASTLEYERALMFRKRIELLERLQQKQSVDLRSKHDQDVIGLATSGEKCCISLLRVKRGVIAKKKDFEFLASDDLMNEFLKTYYEKYQPPHEIILEGSYDKTIPQYLQSLWSRKVSILRPSRGVKRDLLSIAKKNAYARFSLEDPILIDIKEKLELDEVPAVIDCFDISNIGKSVVVGACVQFKNGEPNKSAYRLYNVRGNFGQDDFRSMHEIIKRRYAKMPLPNVIIVDGGLQQVNFALQALHELNLHCAVRGLAKGEETIIFPTGEHLKLNQRLKSSKLIMRMRDAVHDFAIRQSRRRYQHLYKHSALDDIEGIGEKTKFKLLHTFGSLERIKRAKIDEVAKVIGEHKAQIVADTFH